MQINRDTKINKQMATVAYSPPLLEKIMVILSLSTQRMPKFVHMSAKHAGSE